MSTKIYNGFVLPKMSLDQLHKLVLKMRERMACIHDDLYHERMASLCCGILDNYTFQPTDVFLKVLKEECEYLNRFKDPLDWYPMVIADVILRERQQKIKQTMKRDPVYDLDCEMVLIPGKRKIHMLFYAENKAYYEMLETFPEIQEYPYWDNTDPPDDVTRKQWRKRGKEWDKALSAHRSEIPSLCGFTADLVVTGRIMPRVPQILASMPTFEQRVEHYAWKEALKQVFHSQETTESTKRDLYFKALEHLRTDEGKAMLEKEKQRLAKILQPFYTKEDLLKPLKDRDPVCPAEAKNKEI